MDAGQIETAARALSAIVGRADDWDDLPLGVRDAYRDEARAVIAALEPTIRAGNIAAWDEGFDAGERDAFDCGFDDHVCMTNPYGAEENQ